MNTKQEFIRLSEELNSLEKQRIEKSRMCEKLSQESNELWKVIQEKQKEFYTVCKELHLGSLYQVIRMPNGDMFMIYVGTEQASITPMRILDIGDD